MSKTIEVRVVCTECGEELDAEVTLKEWKDLIYVEVSPCACTQVQEENQ